VDEHLIVLGGRIFRDVYDRRPEEILQRNEETWLKETTETNPKAKSMRAFL